MDSRLSYSRFPLATAMTSFASPRSLIKRRTGMMVKPLLRAALSILRISFLERSSLRSRRATWLLYVP
ncbi:hypothetical protein Barb7_01092 [Bacteroidales bacterium Barb7]|nr:hypothetical protein Barb7_01092 [Bacteroidales bacterium Barb7]